MDTENLREQVRTTIGGMSPLGTRAARSTDRLVEDLGYDSLAMIELSLQLESQFGLSELSQDDAEDITTVRDIEDLVERMSAGTEAA
jgi:acyl carrier protein